VVNAKRSAILKAKLQLYALILSLDESDLLDCDLKLGMALVADPEIQAMFDKAK
jgi:hypothetical protein